MHVGTRNNTLDTDANLLCYTIRLVCYYQMVVMVLGCHGRHIPLARKLQHITHAHDSGN
jgi:hypothetical protein